MKLLCIRRLCLVACYTVAVAYGSVASEPATSPPRPEPFSLIPPVDADPSVRHSVSVRVPTSMAVLRNGDSLKVSFPALATTNLMVGHKMVTGMMREDTFYQNGIAHPAGTSLQGGGLEFDSTTNTFTLKPELVPERGHEFVFEHRVTFFETDIPTQHMWSPQSGKRYQVLWTQTFQHTTGRTPDAQALIGSWNSIETGGRDMGDRIVRMQYAFQTNGTFSVSALMKDGEQTQYTGTFTILTNKLRLSIPELGSNDLPYSLTNGVLQIRDPQLDSWVKFRKVSSPSAPTNALPPHH